jgi:hypothetical protein
MLHLIWVNRYRFTGKIGSRQAPGLANPPTRVNSPRRRDHSVEPWR